MRLQRRTRVVQGRGDVNDSASRTARALGFWQCAWSIVLLGTFNEMRETGFGSVVRADDVDLNDSPEGVGAELFGGSKEVSCRAGTFYFLFLLLMYFFA